MIRDQFYKYPNGSIPQHLLQSLPNNLRKHLPFPDADSNAPAPRTPFKPSTKNWRSLPPTLSFGDISQARAFMRTNCKLANIPFKWRPSLNAQVQNFAPFHKGTSKIPPISVTADLRIVRITKDTGGAAKAHSPPISEQMSLLFERLPRMTLSRIANLLRYRWWQKGRS
jgi:hypothetical protein